MWILCPLDPSHGICGMSTIADLCIPCHIFIVLWIIMAVVLWTRVVYISYDIAPWCPLHFCHTCSFNSITLCALGQIKWFCHIHVWFYYPLASSHVVCGISIFFVHIQGGHGLWKTGKIGKMTKKIPELKNQGI